jgi:alkylation response protein AidB-like acyl-CoA dehydrogenase
LRNNPGLIVERFLLPHYIKVLPTRVPVVGRGMRMDFTPTKEQLERRDLARDFAQKEIYPKAGEIEKGHDVFPWEIVKKMQSIGLMSMTIPKKFGGQGFDYVSYAMAVEEVSRASGSVGLITAAHNSLGVGHIYIDGTDEQKQKYLPMLAKDKLSAWGLTESGAGSDAGGTATMAVRDGKDWILNGSKVFITSADVADVIIIIAVTDKTKSPHGTTAFIVNKNNPGYKIGQKEDKLGMRGSPTSEIFLEDCRVPEEDKLGKEGEGFVGALKVLDGGRVSIAALSVGIAQGALDESIKRAKERTAFGRPIGSQEAIQWMIADMATETEAARFLTYRAAYLKDSGKRITTEGAMAKVYASEVAMRNGIKGIQVWGGHGYRLNAQIQRHFRDAKLCEIGEGTSEIQRTVIARGILK